MQREKGSSSCTSPPDPPRLTLSNVWRGSLLKSLAARGDLSGVERSAFFEALSHIDDDYQRSEILGVLIREGTPTQAEVGLILTASQELDFDYYGARSRASCSTARRFWKRTFWRW